MSAPAPCVVHDERRSAFVTTLFSPDRDSQLRDLLVDDSAVAQRLEIRTSGTTQGTSVQIPHLTRLEVFTASQALEVYDRGCAVRSVAATNVHEHSSRSHSVLILEVVGMYGSPHTSSPTDTCAHTHSYLWTLGQTSPLWGLLSKMLGF